MFICGLHGFPLRSTLKSGEGGKSTNCLLGTSFTEFSEFSRGVWRLFALSKEMASLEQVLGVDLVAVLDCLDLVIEELGLVTTLERLGLVTVLETRESVHVVVAVKSVLVGLAFSGAKVPLGDLPRDFLAC